MAVPPVRRGVRGHRQAHRRSGAGLSALRSPARGMVGLSTLAAPRGRTPHLGPSRSLPDVPGDPRPAARLRARAAPGQRGGHGGRPRARHGGSGDAQRGGEVRPGPLDRPRLATTPPGPGAGPPGAPRGGGGLARSGAARVADGGRSGGPACTEGHLGRGPAPSRRAAARALAAVERGVRRVGAGDQHEPALGGSGRGG